MKKIYTAPEAKLMSFISAERLATGEIDFDDLLGAKAGSMENVNPSTNDINLSLDSNM